MKGFLKYLAPFAPDQSGVVSALYGFGGLLVVCDAGGCTGNICGFDEPRWSGKTDGPSSAIFSAGLRDMDAILGRDEALLEKLVDAASRVETRFIALIGTPVPAVIATDFDALRREAEARIGLPVLAFPCTGTRAYDVGAREAYRELFRTFAGKKKGDASISGGKTEEPLAGGKSNEESRAIPASGRKSRCTLGVLGATPLDLSRTSAEKTLTSYAKENGFSEVSIYGMGAGLEAVRCAGSVTKNLVVAPAGLAVAEDLRERFGTPYEIGYPFLEEDFRTKLQTLFGKRVLIVHQQAAANEMRRVILGGRNDSQKEEKEEQTAKEEVDKQTGQQVVCGTWFLQIPELTGEQDVTFSEEEEFVSYVENGHFDAVIGDPRFRRALRGYTGEYLDCPHFAVSGILEKEGMG